MNGFDKIMKPPSTLNTSGAVFPTQFPNQSLSFTAHSPVHDTNPWAADARKQQPSGTGDSAHFSGPRHERTTSEAERWLKSIQQQTGAGNVTNMGNPVSANPGTFDPFNWNKGTAGFEVKI